MEHIADIIRIGYLYYQSDSLSQKSIRIADTVVDQLIHFQHPMFARRKTQLQQLLNRIQTLTFGIARALDVLRVIFRVDPVSHRPNPFHKFMNPARKTGGDTTGLFILSLKCAIRQSTLSLPYFKRLESEGFNDSERRQICVIRVGCGHQIHTLLSQIDIWIHDIAILICIGM